MNTTQTPERSLKDRFVKEIEKKILGGELKIGEKLPPVRDLVTDMNISRSVINVGIAELSKKGFLHIKPRIGTFVADYRMHGTMQTLIAILEYNGLKLQDAEIQSVLEVRLALETLALTLIIPKINEEEIQRLYEIKEKIRTAQDVEEASLAAYEFQHNLAILSGNTFLPLIFESFKNFVLILWERFCSLHGIESLYENTDKLYEAIEARDLQKSIAIITEDLKDSIGGQRTIYY